jgi:hypothetical protein
MKRSLLLAAAGLLLALPAAAQNADSLAASFEVDFAVPDAPAFELLGVDPSTAVRPSSVRAFATSLSDFTGGGELFHIPRAFAVEVSPALLIAGKRLTLARYQDNPQLYRFRLSAATLRSEAGSATQLALGMRMSLRDDADLRTNKEYIRDATDVATAINNIYVEARKRMGRPDPANPRPIILTDSERQQVENILKPFRDRYAQTAWNASAFDISAGARASAQDSLGNGLRMEQYALWGTWAAGFGSWGQLLVGVQGGMLRDSVTTEFGTSGSLSARFYAGTNELKIFVEGQGRAAQHELPDWLLHAGGEARLIPRLWTNFSAGVQWDETRDARLVARFTVKMGTPVGF